jgi:hypothetical protein
MLVPRAREHAYVIDETTRTRPSEIAENKIHQPLKSGGGVGDTEGHLQELEETKLCDEGRLFA